VSSLRAEVERLLDDAARRGLAVQEWASTTRGARAVAYWPR